MFCKNCGAQLDDSTVFCTQCGVRLTKSPVPSAQSGSAEPTEEAKAPIPAAEEAATEPSGNIPTMGTIPTSGVGQDSEAIPNAEKIPNAETAVNYELPPAALPVREKTFFGVGALVFCLIIIGALSIATGVFAGLYFSAIA